MLNFFLKIVIALIIIVLQLVFLPQFQIYGVWINLPLLFAATKQMGDHGQDHLFYYLICALILDLAGNHFFGFNLILFVAIFIIIKIIKEKFISEFNPFLIFLGGAAVGIIYFIFSQLLFNFQAVIAFIYSATAAYFLDLILKKVQQKTLAIKI